MAKIQIVILVFLSNWCLGQNNSPVSSVSQSAFKETDKVINEGTANENGSVVNSYVIVFNGDIVKLIDRLRQDFGKKGLTIHENITNRQIEFKKITKPEWTEKKINFGFSSISNRDRHLITITCTDNKKNDYLTPGTETQKKIKAYLQSIVDGK
ncbi:MAG: hypothetical protein QM734_10090 [Cyclobacteriaceae bacterium]